MLDDMRGCHQTTEINEKLKQTISELERLGVCGDITVEIEGLVETPGYVLQYHYSMGMMKFIRKKVPCPTCGKDS